MYNGPFGTRGPKTALIFWSVNKYVLPEEIDRTLPFDEASSLWSIAS